MSDKYKIVGDLEAFRANLPSIPAQVIPPLCTNCVHYIGVPVGAIVVVCSMYPYGNGDDCSSFEGRGSE